MRCVSYNTVFTTTKYILRLVEEHKSYLYYIDFEGTNQSQETAKQVLSSR
jgi:hypothetical protein